MIYSVTFSREVSPVDASAAPRQPVRVRFTVEHVEGFTDHGVFTYSRHPVTDQPVYSHVATVLDMRELLYDNFGEDDFQRKDYVEQVYASFELAEEGIAAIEARVKLLCESSYALTALGEVTTVTIGAP